MAMTNIPAKKNSKIRYMYDPNATGMRNSKPYKGIVIAVMGDCRNDAANALDKIYGHFFGPFPFNTYIPHRFTGVAYCSVEDEFNLNEGLRIARTRMLRKYNKAMKQVLDETINYLNKIIKSILNARIKYM